MRLRLSFVALAALFQSARLFASVPCTLPLGIESLPNGNTVIDRRRYERQSDARVIEVDSTGQTGLGVRQAPTSVGRTPRAALTTATR